MRTQLVEELQLVASRLRTATRMTVLAASWLALFFVGWGLSLGTPLFNGSPTIQALVFLGVAVGWSLGFVIFSSRWFRDLRWVAGYIESRYPELDSRLLTSLDQVRDTDAQEIGFLQQLLISETVRHSLRNPWGYAVSPGRLRFAQMSAVLAFALLLSATYLIAQAERPASSPVVGNSELEDPDLKRLTGEPVVLVGVDPGNTEVEKRGSLLVLARFQSTLPEQAELVVEYASVDPLESENALKRIPMNPSFDDPVFAGQLENVTRPLTYWVEYDDQPSERFYVTLFEYPELQQLDFELDFPDFTNMPNREITDSRRVSALVGTEVTINARLNKTVNTCLLEPIDRGDPIRLERSQAGDAVYSVTFPLQISARYRLTLVDEQGRSNQQPPEIVINALENKVPTIKITAPARDVEVSPVEELATSAQVFDDFGIVRTGLAYSVGGEESVEMVLAEDLPGKQKATVNQLVEFETLQLEPDQIVSYYFWAEDYVSNNKSRRVMSDLFFAEVREFEKIFRQGEQQSQSQQRQQQQQQSQAQQQAAQLLQLQKEVINATWKLIRRETDDEPSKTFEGDVKVIQDSQVNALSLVDRMAQQAGQDPAAAAIASQVKDSMNRVILTLQKALDQRNAEPLQQAVTQEQSVYQLLLRLRPDESQVQQGQQSSSSSSSSQSRSQQQLQQLQLENDRNRYEEQNSATENDDSQQSEIRQALNRLKELARRQEDINDQLKQLQTALEEAQDEEERREIERRLKRLREQQEELLRDLDELKDEAQKNSDNPLMQKASEELEQARQNVRKSAEALKENQVSQAAAAGSRAQQKFEELREEFKAGNANQFAEQMKEMTDQAQGLEDKQQQIADTLRQMDERANRSLRDRDDRKQVLQDLDQQQQKYDEILEEIKDVVREAEESEPLLSQELYDTFREASKSQTRKGINTAENLLSRGFIQESRKAEKVANEGIRELNRGIQKAAENIVGDEAESLRRAEQTLRKLSQQIQSEIQANQPANATNNGDDRNNSDKGKSEPNDAAGGSGKQNEKNQPGQGEPDQAGKPSGESSGKSPGSQDSKSADSKAGKASSQSSGQSKSGSSQSSQGQGQGSPSSANGRPAASDSKSGQPSSRPPADSKGSTRGGNGGRMAAYESLFGPSNGGAARPLTGDDYRRFSNDLREIEELLEDPRMRSRASEIREKAKTIRAEMKRRSKEPNWDVVQDFIAEPLEQLRVDVARELLLKENRDALVPIDRDPVPPVFEEQVKQYYKELSDVEK